MAKFLKCFLIIVLLLSSGAAHGWDTTAAKLYPLAVGNLWSYNYKTYAPPNGCVNLLTEINYIVSIVGDTIMPNSKKYFKFDDRGSFSYRRIDSITMNVYQYLTSSGTECLYDSLKATTNSTYSGCSSPSVITAFSTINQWGANRLKRDSRPVPCPGCGRSLVEGIGFFADFICLSSGSRTDLNGCIINGIQFGQIIGVINVSAVTPEKFSLYANYPNPFNPATKIKFDVMSNSKSRMSNVKLTVYDALGRVIRILVDQQLSPGAYEVEFDGTNFASGIYFYRISAAGENQIFTRTLKMVLIK